MFKNDWLSSSGAFPVFPATVRANADEEEDEDCDEEDESTVQLSSVRICQTHREQHETKCFLLQ